MWQTERLQKSSLKSGQFAPARGGQFAPAQGGQFSPASGGQFDRFLHAKSPIEMWNLALEISKSINNVGVALICDFLKEIGFTRYVKVGFAEKVGLFWH